MVRASTYATDQKEMFRNHIRHDKGTIYKHTVLILSCECSYQFSNSNQLIGTILLSMLIHLILHGTSIQNGK